MTRTGLPPEGAVLLLHPSAGTGCEQPRPFRAIVVRPGDQADTAVLRGWFLDVDDIAERHLTVELAGVEVISEA